MMMMMMITTTTMTTMTMMMMILLLFLQINSVDWSQTRGDNCILTASWDSTVKLVCIH